MDTESNTDEAASQATPPPPSAGARAGPPPAGTGPRPVVIRAGSMPPRLVTADGKPIVLRARGPLPPGSVIARPLVRPPPSLTGTAASPSRSPALAAVPEAKAPPVAARPTQPAPEKRAEDAPAVRREVYSSASSMNSAIERDVRPWLDLVEALRQEGVQEDMPLPQIAVMGDQSSGKSSVLEALSGVQFPRGSGLVTRCPIQLTMTRAKESEGWSARAYIHWVKGGGGGGGPPRRAGKSSGPGAVEVGSPSELTKAISRLMDTVTGGDPNLLSSDTIMVEMSSPDLPDLTLIDLPGIVRTSTAGQSESVIRDVNNLIQDFLNQERTIILCVIPSNQDISTIDILERAYKVDPEGDRTIGVLTKPDLINPGGEEEVLAVVQNVRKPLKLGYIMVKNRNQNQLNQHMTLREAQHDELDFFKSHPYFSEVPESQLGVGSLARKLTRVLVTRIQSSLPYMKHELLEKLERTGKEVEALGDPAPAELSQCRSAVMQLITRYSKVLRESLRGDYREQSLVQRPELRIRGLAEASFRAIQFTMQGTRPDFTSQAFLENLAKEVVALRGRELPGFCNSVFFHGYMMQYVEQWRNMVDANRAGLVEAVRRAAYRIMPAVVPNYPRLSEVTREVVVEAFKEIEAGLDVSLEEVFAREHDPFTVNDDLILAVDKVRFHRFDDVCEQVLEAVKNDPSFREGHQAIQEAVLSQLGGWYMANHGADLDAKVGDQQTVLMAYFNVCSKRVLDNVCMVIENKLLQAVPDLVMTELVNTVQCQSEEDIMQLFMEDDHTKNRRVSLAAQQRRLSAAIDLITRVAPEVVAKPKPATVRAMRAAAAAAAAANSSSADDDQVNQLPAVPGRHQGGLSAAEREGQKEGGGCLAVFKFSHSGDNQGLIYWLGTGGGAQTYRNPHDDKKIQITSSGMARGMSESIIVSRRRLACWTEDSKDSWIALDFGGKGFVPTHYTLCNGSPDPGFDFRGWALEGWSDKLRNWVVIDPPHASVPVAKTLASPYGVNTFQVPKVDTAQRYRRIRIKSCTPNSLGTHSIPLCALEVYGKLYPAPT